MGAAPCHSKDRHIELIDVANDSENERVNLESVCQGYMLTFPNGKTPNAHYPFVLHDHYELPWISQVHVDHMVLVSKSCQEWATNAYGSCVECKALESHPILEGIRHRIKEGVKSHTPYHYHSHASLASLARQSMKALDVMHVWHLTLNRKLANKLQVLDKHQQFLLAIGSGKVERVDRLVRSELKQGSSIHKILDDFNDAINRGLRHVNYTEVDEMKQVLNWKMGGVQLAEISHRNSALPSLSTARRRVTVLPLVVSPAFPRVAEILQNLENSFKGIGSIIAEKRVLHQVLMFDEISVEKRPRYDEKTNKFLGLCREHIQNTTSDFNSKEDLETLLDDLDNGVVHLGSEVSNHDVSKYTTTNVGLIILNRQPLEQLAFLHMTNNFILHALLLCQVLVSVRMPKIMLH